VESVAPDPYGIPHVKFNLTFSRTNRFSSEEGPRMLALRTFADRYREKVPAVSIWSERALDISTANLQLSIDGCFYAGHLVTNI